MGSIGSKHLSAFRIRKKKFHIEILSILTTAKRIECLFREESVVDGIWLFMPEAGTFEIDTKSMPCQNTMDYKRNESAITNLKKINAITNNSSIAIGFRVLEVPWRNGFKASWMRLFFIFGHIFGIIDDFLKWSAPKALQNFEKIIKKCQKFDKKWTKALFNLL